MKWVCVRGERTQELERAGVKTIHEETQWNERDGYDICSVDFFPTGICVFMHITWGGNLMVWQYHLGSKNFPNMI